MNLDLELIPSFTLFSDMTVFPSPTKLSSSHSIFKPYKTIHRDLNQVQPPVEVTEDSPIDLSLKSTNKESFNRDITRENLPQDPRYVLEVRNTSFPSFHPKQLLLKIEKTELPLDYSTKNVTKVHENDASDLYVPKKLRALNRMI